MENTNIVEPLHATLFTKNANEEVYKSLDFDNLQDYEDANRGLIAPLAAKVLKNKHGQITWDIRKSEFLDSIAPDSVNPSLWRNSQLQAISGLFKVVEGVYQVRGQSIATTIIIEGESGVIVCDTLMSIESAKAAMELYYKHRPKKPVTAIIISQSHADHFSGIQAVLEYAESPNIPIIVPEHFTEEALSENVLLGPIMLRRAQYQFAPNLSANSKGTVSIGIGPVTTSGTQSFELPNIEIEKEIQAMMIDGIRFQFLLTPNTEAPAEMHFYVKDYKILFVSENVNRSMHQIYTVRGAKTRDALLWANSIDKTIDLFKNEEIEALVMAHAWPVWEKDASLKHLRMQRDLYKYMHDQTIRLANHGYTMDEIAEMMKLPEALNKYWGNRGYYGTLKHNVKGIYNYYLGYYSGHPSDLDPLPQVEAGKKYIQYMGGIHNIIRQAKADYENGEYRWVAQVMKHVVMAEPNNNEAKYLLANTFEQLGYQSESANWRNIYLVGAFELRNGINHAPPTNKPGFINKIPVEDFLKLLAIKLNAPKAEGKKIIINVTITNLNEQCSIYLGNSVLINKTGELSEQPDVTIITDKLTFYSLGVGRISLDQAIEEDKLKISGDSTKLIEFLSLLDHFNPSINIVTP